MDAKIRANLEGQRDPKMKPKHRDGDEFVGVATRPERFSVPERASDVGDPGLTEPSAPIDVPFDLHHIFNELLGAFASVDIERNQRAAARQPLLRFEEAAFEAFKAGLTELNLSEFPSDTVDNGRFAVMAKSAVAIACIFCHELEMSLSRLCQDTSDLAADLETEKG